MNRHTVADHVADFICNIALIPISEECNLQKSTFHIFTAFPFPVHYVWIQTISPWAFDQMGFRSSLDSVLFTWPQDLLKIVDSWEDPGINGEVRAIPWQHKHNSIRSKQRESFSLCMWRWLLGSGPPLLLGQFSCGRKKSTVRKHPVSDAEGGWGQLGLESKILAVAVVLPVRQDFTPPFLTAVWGDIFSFSPPFSPWVHWGDASRCRWATRAH